MRRRKYFFDFKIEISVKFRVEWCVRLYDSYWICQCSLYFVHLHAYANTNYWGNTDKFNIGKSGIQAPSEHRILHGFKIRRKPSLKPCFWEKRTKSHESFLSQSCDLANPCLISHHWSLIGFQTDALRLLSDWLRAPPASIHSKTRLRRLSIALL